MSQKTHRLNREPYISARHLADYMAASETARRTIARSCKYPPIARLLQHDEAKMAVSKFVRDGKGDLGPLHAEAERLRTRMADSPFERDLYDTNADYIARFAEIAEEVDMPDAARLAPGRVVPLMLNGVKVTAELHFRLRRLTRTNKVRVGAGMLRYAKGKALPPEIGAWQSAFISGYLRAIGIEDGAEVENGLCLTVDAYSGVVHPAPGDAYRRFQHMEAACATIAERWENIDPPKGAVI